MNGYNLIQPQAFCYSDRRFIGKFTNDNGLADCAEACDDQDDCRYISFGVSGSAKGKCYGHHSTENCKGKLYQNDYDFYDVGRTRGKLNIYSPENNISLSINMRC